MKPSGLSASLCSFYCLVALILCAGDPARAQTSDFNAMDDDGWTHYDPIAETGLFGPQNSWTFLNGGYRLQAAPTPNPALGPARVASLRQDIVYTNFFLTVDLVDWNNDFIEAIGLLARVNEPGPGTTDGYVFGVVTGPTPFVQIARIDDEGTDAISDAAPILLEPDRDYRFEFTGKFAELRGRVFALPDLTTPIATVMGTDSVYNFGTAGLVSYSLNDTVAEAADATFDNYVGLDHEPPHLSIEVNQLGETIISWPSDVPPYRLQSTPTLPATEWTEVSGTFDNGVRWEYFTEPGGDALFYRLIRP